MSDQLVHAERSWDEGIFVGFKEPVRLEETLGNIQ